MIKVLIADDQVIFRESLKYILEQDTDIIVVGLAGDGKEASRLCDLHKPDIVLMDIVMPVCDGAEGTKLIKGNHKDIKVLILTTFNDRENITNCLMNGADGYLLKEVKPDELVLAIKGSVKGLNIIHQNTYEAVRDRINSSNDNSNNSKSTSFKPCEYSDTLEDREIEIIKLVAKGKSNKEIGAKLYVSEGTIKNIITAILKKLDLEDRIALVVYAVKRGWV